MTPATSTQPLLRVPVTGMYFVALYLSVAEADAAGSVTLSVTWTENGVARSMSLPTYSLADASVAPYSRTLSIWCDEQTLIECQAACSDGSSAYFMRAAVNPLS